MKIPLHFWLCILFGVVSVFFPDFFTGGLQGKEKRVSDAGKTEAGYSRITGPCHLAFPRDHGAHESYRTEWWYYTGNVRDKENRLYGFQLTFFRSRISPPDKSFEAPKPSSAWRTNQIYLGHCAVSDIGEKRYFKAERTLRKVRGLDLAGVFQKEAGSVCMKLNTWSAKIGKNGHELNAAGDNFRFRFRLQPEKPPVLHGDSGYSKKGLKKQSASCYYSFTRLLAKGTITLDGKRRKVSGLAWMDHEFSSDPLEPDLVGWDWFSIQLDNRMEVMAYFLRKKDGGYSPASSATVVFENGDSVRVPMDFLSAISGKNWESPKTGAVYPIEWTLKIKGKQVRMNLDLRANIKNQEMVTPRSTGVSYWEGSVTAGGDFNGRPVKGLGYLEMTGYEKPFDAPM